MPDSPRPQSLDEAFARTIRSMRVTALAAATGLREKDLYRWATLEENPSGEHRHPPAHVIEPISRATGRVDVLEYLASQLGWVLVPCIAPRGGGPLTVLAGVASLTREFGDVQGGAAGMLLDGEISSPEAAALDGELVDLIREAATMRLVLRARGRKDLARVDMRVRMARAAAAR